MAGQYFVYKFNLLRMKTRHLFTVALAAFAFAACSQDDDINTNSEPQPGEKGALVEGISINFGESSNSSKTRAASGSQIGEGSEGMIYEAYIFAKEANPTHPRSLVGDWTVLRVTADQGTGAMVVETGGVDTETTLKKDLEKAINENSKADVEWLVKNVATFHGVRQGDYVYVIANDPNLTLAQAAVLAHNGEKSEEDIKGYVASINKDYLNGLVYPGDAKDADGKKILPTGKLVMAGREMIPVSPNIPSNGTFSMTIGLDRELSKVNFSASISTNDADAAKGKVAFLEDDGIVVARIARKASPFAEKTADWYVPGNNCVEDWPINDHSLANNKYTAFCDNTREGSFVFDGTAAAPITDWNKGVTIAAGFNGVAPASSVTEYRYSWKLNDTALKDNKQMVYLSGDKGTIYAPVFYTTPNYSANTNSVTVICTQATYIDRGVFKNSNMIDTYVDAALNETKETIEIFTAAETSGDPLTVKNPLKFEATSATVLAKSDILDKVKVAVKNWGIKMFDKSDAFDVAADALPAADKAIWEATTKPDFAAYQKMMDRFYVAVLLQQRLANKGDKETGNSTASSDKMNWGNGITSGKDGYYTNADTDSLLVGYKKLDDNTLVNDRFYFYVDMSEASVEGMIANAMFMPSPVVTGVKSGAEVRAAYFADIDSYQYIKGQKLYYRADIADYVGGASNKLTERNMYYVSRGTIQSLGAKSIHDAIYSDQNTMHIDVKVNDWKLSINQIPM